jgi:hypothetical protein
MLLTGGVGAGHQHKVQRAWSIALPRPEGLEAVQALRQGPDPGAQLAGAIAHQHDGCDRWREGRRSFEGRIEAALLPDISRIHH